MHGTAVGWLADDLHVGDTQKPSVGPDIAVTTTFSVCAHVANRFEFSTSTLSLERKDTALFDLGLRVTCS
jgi:hypothetical protein